MSHEKSPLAPPCTWPWDWTQNSINDTSVICTTVLKRVSWSQECVEGGHRKMPKQTTKKNKQAKKTNKENAQQENEFLGLREGAIEFFDFDKHPKSPSPLITQRATGALTDLL